MVRCLLMSLVLGAVACGPSFEAQTPSGFVELEERDHSRYDYRATTAEGVVLAVRELDNDVEGEKEFWLTAIRNKMRERGGYALIKETEVQSADGVSGTQLTFGHDDGDNKPHIYHLAIFVTPDTIWLLEAGGTKELVDKSAKQIAGAIAAFRTQ